MRQKGSTSRKTYHKSESLRRSCFKFGNRLVALVLPFTGLSLFKPLNSVTGSTAFGITWEVQADRLQKISSTLLDGYPIYRPIDATIQLGAAANISLLPKVNPKIGAKNEKVPSSPLHMIPFLEFGGSLGLSSVLKAGAGLTLGYLPAGSEKLLGLKTAIKEDLVGGHLQFQWHFSPIFGINLASGYQQTKSLVKGPIASKVGSDTFESTTGLTWVALAADFRSVGIWADVQTGLKNTTSRLTIQEDETDLTVTDKLEDSAIPVWSQFTLGWQAGDNVWFALSELVVPARLYMTRISMGTDITFLNDPAEATNKSLRSKKSKKIRRKKNTKDTLSDTKSSSPADEASGQ